MYFISRNNRIYNYIAHTKLMRCYLATLIVVCAIFLVSAYCAYYPLLAHNALLHAESVTLQKKYDEAPLLHKSEQELSSLLESGKKNITDKVLPPDKREEHCHARMLFVLDGIAQSGLTLHGYGSCKEKDKVWYTKDVARFEISGSFEKLMLFLEKMKNSRHMITISQTTITRTADDIFQLSCDVGLVTIKK